MQSRLTQFKNILALVLFGLVFSLVSQRAEAQYNFSLLHSFSNTITDGVYPDASLTLDRQGNLYGTTLNGGEYGWGTVFKIDILGQFSLLHSFNNSDGGSLSDRVTLDGQGNLYGTSEVGGFFGYGEVFKVDSQDNFSLIHSFNYSDTFGYGPAGSVTLDSQGNLYGTTYWGGAHNVGTVYKIDSQGNISLLHSFNISNGAYPFATLTLDSKGNLYGTTSKGGVYDSANGGDGTVFKIDSQGNFTLLHSFNENSTTDGFYPTASVTCDSLGNLYGTTGLGGTFDSGTVYKINSHGNFSLLHSFNWQDLSDGSGPDASVTLDNNGNLYGTTISGGANIYYGTVFKIDSHGNFSLLHSFNNDPSDGENPASVTLDSKGNLYGTSYYGGAYHYGTVFELANNITAPTVSFTYHGFVHRPGSHTIVQQITITNTSGTALTGPFNLVVSGLPSGITLINATGTTAFNDPDSPYLTVGSSSLAVGASTTVTLNFNDPHLGDISYTPTFLKGNGTP